MRLDNVSKRYRIGSGQAGLRAALARLPRTLIRRNGRDSDAEHIWALRDISFAVNPGEALGIVGRNGAGKTTILKLLSRITQPTRGRLHIDGRVSALIELGAGFHPELTGLDNVYLYATILGLRRHDIDRRLPSIIDFAELHTFMDTPVKRYSSGMYARLAFSVAAHIDPDVLLVDEVLAVGDRNFQQKCFDFIHSFVRSGKTTIFISHNLYAVEQLCDRLIWLDRGRIVESGNPSRVLESYLSFLEDTAADAPLPAAAPSDRLQVSQVRLTDAAGQEKEVFSSGEDVIVNLDYQADQRVERPHFCIWVSDTAAPEPLFAANMLLDGAAPEYVEGRGTIRCVFKRVPLMPRVYYVWAEVYGADRAAILFRWRRLARFQVVDSLLLERINGQRGAVRFARSHGPMRIPYEWSEPAGERPAAERQIAQINSV